MWVTADNVLLSEPMFSLGGGRARAWLLKLAGSGIHAASVLARKRALARIQFGIGAPLGHGTWSLSQFSH